ncbi:serine/threonine protein phosphatase, putative [Cryptosporidium muris RN66]|uniref:Serine/threonine-protein phosphatase n=1 Tax=Cryptosporidium muris (strain RN66) TaxID=441375 RepID=B6AEM6_CRYMR|nr:serine/threonine protein phosphatase, putative [Cryptosporidium muris RN66]EEA06643.1 serine/threonine protein phosphatase, putative [Cryptosporidium muris RN66]|eukprot:XP_002140992.1 serine/threonine protein phosphatase [Cryptosporidium muris RN66]
MNISTIYGPNIGLDSNLKPTRMGSMDQNTSARTIRPEQWEPWKSFGKLLNDSIIEMGWQERYSILRDVVNQYGISEKGFLTLDEFLEILNDNPITNEEYRTVFYNLMDRNQDGKMSETEFTSGMLSLSPLATNDPRTSIGQLRLQFIFLYYDSDRNGLLSLNELKKMLLHISAIRSLANNTKTITESKAREYAIHLIAHYDGVFGFNAFYTSVLNNILKGTGWLLRTHKDLVDYINNRGILEDTSMVNTNQSTKSKFSPSQNSLLSLGIEEGKGTVDRITETQPISRNLIQTETITLDNSFIKDNIKTPCYNNNKKPFNSSILYNGQMSDIEGSVSIDKHTSLVRSTLLNKDLKYRIIEYYMDLARFLHMGKLGIEESMNITNIATVDEIMKLCDTVVELFRKENSLIQNSEFKMPVRIFGDIHGQLFDILHFFEKFSWPHYHRGDILSMNYIFLGDYVDRGKFSLEVIFLLFSFKILFPNKIMMLRGNHEDPLMNLSYGFHTECVRKYGSHYGHLLWERVNDVFEFLSLGIVVEDQILCVHGGIGKNIQTLDDIKDIPKPIHVSSDCFYDNSKHEFETVNACNAYNVERKILDCLWSDPIDDDINDEKYLYNETDVDCITNNSDNENRVNVYNYNCKDIDAFMNNTGIKLIVRAHECIPNGYEYFANGKVLTLFSTTNYCNNYKNDAAMCVFMKNTQNDNLIHFNQIIKYKSIDNSFGWIDDCTGTGDNLNNKHIRNRQFDHVDIATSRYTNTPVNRNFNVDNHINKLLNSSAFISNYKKDNRDFKDSVLKKSSPSNSASTNRYANNTSPRSYGKVGNLDIEPITPHKIQNIIGKPINLTAFD